VLVLTRRDLVTQRQACANRLDAPGAGPVAQRLRAVIACLTEQIAALEADIAALIAQDTALRHAADRLRAIPGIGFLTAVTVIVEVGDISRFGSAAQLCSWAGLTPRHRESDTTVHRGHITKQGSRLVRWAAVEAVGRQGANTAVAAHHHRVAERRGSGIGRVAAARKLLVLVYWGLRDGHIRCLASAS
ncbi:MAG: transposase, partial [Streptosporangiaceae bacterium]